DSSIPHPPSISASPRSTHQLAYAFRSRPRSPPIMQPSEDLGTLAEGRDPDHVPFPGGDEHSLQGLHLIVEHRHFLRSPVDRPGPQSINQVLSIPTAQIFEQLRDNHVIGAPGRRVTEPM